MSFKVIGILMMAVLGTLLLLSRKWSKKQKYISALEAKYTEKLLQFKSSPTSVDPEKLRLAGQEYWQAKGFKEDEVNRLVETDMQV